MRYREVYAPRHPRANSQGRVREHIIAWEQAHGLELPEAWVVHHLNEDKLDNRPENLEAMPDQEHRQLHSTPEKMRARGALGVASRRARGWVQPRKTQCKHGHELSPENRGSSAGRCLRCHARRQRERMARLRALASQQKAEPSSMDGRGA